MYHSILIFCLVQCSLSDMHSTHSYFTRKSRSDSIPTDTGYVYSQIGSQPPIYSSYGDNYLNHNPSVENESESKSAEKLGSGPFAYNDMNFMQAMSETIMPHTPYPISKHSLDYEIARAKAKTNYESNYLPSKIKSDILYEKMKSAMHYQPPTEADAKMFSSYDLSNDFHLDDDDVRTSSRGLYDVWPYFYHNPYEYDNAKIDSDIEKAKDKRYVLDNVKDIIPVHEHIEGDTPNDHDSLYLTPRYNREVTSDNPIVGDGPFISFVLDDYSDRSNDYDPLSFKGSDWGKEFDYETESKYKNNINKEGYYENDFYPEPYHKYNYLNNKLDDFKSSLGESSTEKGYNKNSEFDKHIKGENKRISNMKEYDDNGKQYKGFKNFLDSFLNKFGAEDQKKDSKYSFKTEQDKGEKKKGFRKVYHKDEFKEDNEFYDNNNSNIKTEENGSSNAHAGGSEAFLKSYATASTNDESNSYRKTGNSEDDKHKNEYKGHDRNEALNRQFDKYINVAQQAAQSNGADYTDHDKI